MSQNSEEVHASAGALAAIRAARMRAPDQPTLAERRAFADNPAALKRLRKVWGDPTIASAVHEAFDQAKRVHKASGAAAIAIAETLPSHLAAKVHVVQMSRGVLTLGVPDSSTRYMLDRLLRSGAQTALLKRVPASVRSLKIVISAPKADGLPDRRRPIDIGEMEREDLDG